MCCILRVPLLIWVHTDYFILGGWPTHTKLGAIVILGTDATLGQETTLPPQHSMREHRWI